MKGGALECQREMGDLWEHTVVIAEVLQNVAADPVRCLADAPCATPEGGFGGVSGYAGLLEALKATDHPLA